MKAYLTILAILVFNLLIYHPEAISQNLDGGVISSTSPEVICSGDKKDSKVKIKVSGKKGKSFNYFVINPENIIADIQKSGNFNLFGSESGNYTFYHVSYDKNDFNAVVGLPFDDLSGTYDLSNSLAFTLGDAEATVISFENGGTEMTTCGDGEPIEIILSGEIAETSAWIVTDKKGEIISIPASVPLDTENLPDERLTILHLNAVGAVSGLEVGARINKLSGCFALSNELTLEFALPEGGTLEGDSLFFCVGDNLPDKIHGNDIRLVGASKPKGQWVVTDTSGIIQFLPKNPHQLNFDGEDPGICLIWHVAFGDELEGLEIGNSIEDLEGCFDFSNSIAIVKTLANGGLLDHGIVKICVESDSTVFLSEEYFELSDTAGSNFAWVITTRNKTILGFSDSLSNIDLSDKGTDKFFVYFLAYGDDMTGLEVGNRINDLTGCFDFSNQVPVNLSKAFGGEITGSVAILCSGESGVLTLDTTDLVLTGAEGDNSTWLLTDPEGNIVAISHDPSSFEISDTATGTLYLWHISFGNDLEGLEVGINVSELDGCFGLSNSIPIETGNVDGGVLEGGPFGFCIDNGEAFIEPGNIILSEQEGPMFSWLITDSSGMILAIPGTPEEVNFAAFGNGICFVWHLAYEEGIEGLEVDSLVSNLSGCFDFSNSVEVVKDQPMGGFLEGGPFEICVGDDAAYIPEDSISLSENIGMNRQWVITDTSGIILGLPESPYEVDFSLAGPGICQIWHLSYAEGLEGLEVDSLVSLLEGCFDFSNPLTVIRSGGNGGTLEGGPFYFCVDDGVVDNIPVDSITLIENIGSNFQWVITDINGIILGLPDDIYAVNFDSAGVGTCLIYHLSYEDGILGLIPDSLISNLEGCFDLSNTLEVVRDAPDGGIITGGPFGFCTDDPELLPLEEGAITLSGESGMNFSWIVTDTSLNILAISESPYTVDYVALGTDKNLIWHISYTTGLNGLDVDNNVQLLEGCFDLSNSIEVFKGQSEGGSIEGGPFFFCVGDGIIDTIPDNGVTLVGNTGINSQWVVTDTQGLILGLPVSPNEVDFDEAPAGICLLWHLAYDGDLTGLEVGSNAADLSGCFDFSNSIVINRENPDGGMLDGGPFFFCVGDGIPDTIGVDELTLLNPMGSNQQYLLTDTNGIILSLPENIHNEDFDGASEGICLLWNISFQTGITGLEVDSSIINLIGCYDLSDSIIINRSSVAGGEIITPGGTVDTSYCADDGIADLLLPVLSGQVGESGGWLLTDTSGIILAVQDTVPYDFEGSEAGQFRLWHIAYNGIIEGLEADSLVSNLNGCYALSNPINITALTGADCDTNGLVEENGRVALSAKQNPVQDHLMIEVKTVEAMGRGFLIVQNMNGNTILKENIQMVDERTMIKELNTSEWKNGIYFITIVFPAETRSIKIVKHE